MNPSARASAGKREVVDHLTDVGQSVTRRGTLEVVLVDPFARPGSCPPSRPRGNQPSPHPPAIRPNPSCKTIATTNPGTAQAT